MKTTFEVAPECALSDLPDRIVVSPGYGRVSLSEPHTYTAEGELVRAGEVLARLEANERSVDVCAPCDAWVVGYLLRDGERVTAGAPLIHLRAL